MNAVQEIVDEYEAMLYYASRRCEGGMCPMTQPILVAEAERLGMTNARPLVALAVAFGDLFASEEDDLEVLRVGGQNE